MNKPKSRANTRRSSLNDKRDLTEKPPKSRERERLAATAWFGPYSKHKKNPHAYKLKAWSGPTEDVTYCDEHAGFMPEDMPHADTLLRRGIAAGLFGNVEKNGDPTMFWSVDDNGWIFEARVTNPGYGEYHAYPVMPNEAIAQKVLKRYEDHVDKLDDAALRLSLERAQDHYR